MNTVFKWQEYKRAIENEFSIIDKRKQEVPFILNKAQDDIIQQLTEQNIILKARKLGFSSLMLAIGAIKFLFGENERVVSMSFDKSASAKQLLRAKQFIRSFEYKNNAKLNLKYNSKTEMAIEDVNAEGKTYTNTLTVGTARNDSFGRGDDITFLHLTEVAMTNNLQQLLAGVGEALVDNAMLTLETTANGYGEFKDFWDNSVKGLTGFKPFFYNSSWEYSQEYLEKRRMKLQWLFPQEYPMTPDEAFIKMGGKIYPEFSQELDVHAFELDTNAKYTSLLGFDFAVRGFVAVLPAFIDLQGDVLIPDCYKERDKTADQHATDIITMLEKYAKLQDYEGLGDPAGWIKNQQGIRNNKPMQWSLADEYIELGFSLIPANNSVVAGINYVKQLFAKRKIHIHPRCVDLINELMEYQWKPLTNTQMGKMDDPEKVRKINDHLCFTADTKIDIPIGVQIHKMYTGKKDVYEFMGSKVTANHPYLTQRGFLPLDTLRYSDNIVIWKNKLLMELPLGGIQTPIAVSLRSILYLLQRNYLAIKQNACTGIYGKNTLVKYLKVIKYIIEITIRLTMQFLTSNFYQLRNTTIGTMKKIYQFGEKTLRKMHNQKQLNGTSQKRVTYSTNGFLNCLGKTERFIRKYVVNVVEDINQYSQQEANSATIIAKLKHLGKEDVYSITTTSGFFLANNVVVSNCDCLRYLLYSKPVVPEPDPLTPTWGGEKLITFKPWWVKDEKEKDQTNDKYTSI